MAHRHLLATRVAVFGVIGVLAEIGGGAASARTGETPVPWMGIPGVWLGTDNFNDRLDESDSEDDCGSGSGGMPLSSAPVDVATGTKFETATDLVVSLTGRDFVLKRSYTSDIRTGASDWWDIDYAVRSWPPLTDRISPTSDRWVFSPFQQIQHAIDGSDGHIVMLADARRLIRYTSGTPGTIDTRWTTDGPSDEYFELGYASDRDPETNAVHVRATLRLYRPGRVERHFYRPIREVSGDLKLCNEPR